MSKYFATTPIYYVNDVPHIGHTYTTVAADVITRFWKQKGYDARLLTGTDEHGAKIAEAAKAHDEEPKEYADKIAAEYKKSWDLLNIDYARFIRTTDEDHLKTAQDFLQKLYDNGAIDAKPRLYEGLYCVSCEKFWKEEDLKEGLCPDHLKPPIKHSEENYYFNLSKYRDQLTELISENKIKVGPHTRKNEILGKLKQGLEDISISRANLEWGIPLPFDPKHTSYVWIEALINYYTYGKPNGIWPADLHLVGKDILWFHSVIWPAMLLAINEELPREVFDHGFFSIDGQKMSKTLGNVIKPADLISKYGVDGTRVVLLAAFPFGEDGDFSFENLDQIYNSHLANGLGNLTARVAKLCENSGFEAKEKVNHFDPEVEKLLGEFKFNEALNWIWKIVQRADQRVNETAPWKLEGIELQEVLDELVSLILDIAFNLQPFMPETSEKILKQFSGSVKSRPSLFPRLNSGS